MAGPQRLARSPSADAEKILRAFNTWAFKREQPSDPQLMLATIARSAQRNAPVSFVLYWGKGPRCNIGHWDIECLDFLSSLARRVRAVYLPGASIKLILTDTHARLNGHQQTAIAHYFGDIEQQARERGFASCWLGDLVKAPGLNNIITADDPPPDMLQKLLACASKWYRGGGSPEQGAIDYYQVNMLEKRAVENSHPHSIFITFNGSEFRNLFPPHLPIFYMYSLRRGTSIKPWFLPSDAEPGGVATAHGSQLPEKKPA
jgi:L-tyrosine isonitrile synthase